MEPDIQAYVSVMTEIRHRTSVVTRLQSGEIDTGFAATQVETAILQVRMITELIALASLAANRAVFEQNQAKFEKHWDPVKILKDIERLNPGFYPKPVAEVPSVASGVKADLQDLTSGFLTRRELIDVHGQCGNALHAHNPYGRPFDYERHWRLVPIWIGKIMRLLNTHQIRLLDDAKRFYLIHMKEEQDDRVHYYLFERADA